MADRLVSSSQESSLPVPNTKQPAVFQKALLHSNQPVPCP